MEYQYIVNDNSFPVNIPRKLRDDFFLDNNKPDDTYISAQVKTEHSKIPPIYTPYDERIVIGYNTYVNRNNPSPEFNIQDYHSFSTSPVNLYACWGYGVSAVSENIVKGDVHVSKSRVSSDEEVNIIALPNDEYYFSRWSIPHVNQVLTLKIKDNTSLTAYFTKPISVDKFESSENKIGLNKIYLRQGRYNIFVIGGAGGNSGACGSDNQIAAATGGGGLLLSGVFNNTTDDCYDVMVANKGTPKTHRLDNWYNPIKAEDGEDSFISCGNVFIAANGGKGACYGWIDTENKNTVGIGGSEYLSIGMLCSFVKNGNDGNYLSGLQNETEYIINGSGYTLNEYPYGSSQKIIFHPPAINHYTTKQDFHGNGDENGYGYVSLDRLSYVKFTAINDSGSLYTYHEEYLNRLSNIIEPVTPQREGYEFKGWSLDGINTIELSDISLKNDDNTCKDIELSAVWKQYNLIVTDLGEYLITDNGIYIEYYSK